ncbi:hypothetical protein SLS57_000228 [Botryosphaeria dothidea]
MQLIQVLQISTLFSLISAYPAVPADDENGVLRPRYPDELSAGLLRRGDGKSEKSPKDLELDFKKYPGAFDVLEADCMMILCFGAPKTLQRGEPKDRSKRNTASGASLEPFHTDQLKKRETTRRSDKTNSPEEYPYESVEQGGKNALLIGVTEGAQTEQGKYLSGGYTSNSIKPGDWFQHSYANIPDKSVYCKALVQKKSPDSVCKGRDKNDMINFVYQKEKEREGNKPWTLKHMQYGRDKWTKP